MLGGVVTSTLEAVAHSISNVSRCSPAVHPIAPFTLAALAFALSRLTDARCSQSLPIVDDSGHGPLHFASARDSVQNLEVLKCLLGWQNNALYVDLADKVKGSTPLHVACTAGAAQCLRLLLGVSSSPSYARRADGFTPLHAAAASGQHACCR